MLFLNLGCKGLSNPKDYPWDYLRSAAGGQVPPLCSVLSLWHGVQWTLICSQGGELLL